MEIAEVKEKKIRVGITHGDINGIGYEIIIKSLNDPRMLENLIPVVFGSSKVASYHRKTLHLNEFNFNLVKKSDMAHAKRANIVNIIDEEVKVDLGISTPTAGQLAMLSLEMATEELKRNHLDVLVTAPINKKNIQQAGFQFPGHTEYLAEKFNTSDYLMLMICRNLRIGVITGHVPLGRVPGTITQELILKKIAILDQSLKRDFAISKPRIAILALNPHSGDDGVIGNEDQQVVIPAIQKAFDKGTLVYGPFPADGFFGSSGYNNFDGILAMYHDQGMIPFKLLSFEEGVNYTAGLPYIRTSPAHGTAYEIAGKNIASPDSFRQAIYLACDIFNNRLQYIELAANALGANHTKPNDFIQTQREGGIQPDADNQSR
ncbi:MAG: 4-hydroxythreonine-4-phosphate dehydrogenase PdxA [Bacteroidetes bacterium]|nr:4-hydroxythreonine-4-phosphate dehydrogenase PdxA [Bacteroidota bacterium]